MNPPRKRRLIRLVVRASLALVALVVAAYLLRAPLFGGLLRTRLEAELSAALDTRVTIGSVQGGWLSDLTLVDVDLPDRDPDAALRRARCARIACRYRLLDVLDDPLAGLDDIDVDGLDVAIDPSVTPDGAEPVDADAVVADLIRSFRAALPPIRVAGALELTTGETRVAARIEATRRAPGEVDVLVTSLDVALADRTLHEDALRIGLRGDATSVRLEQAIRVGGVEVRELRAELVDDGARVVARLGIGGDVDVAIDDTTIHARLRRVDLAAIPEELRDLVSDALPRIPAVVVDAELEIDWRAEGRLVARDVQVVLGASTLNVREARMGDLRDPATVSWQGLELRVPDPAELAAHLGVELPTWHARPIGWSALRLDSGTGTRDEASVRIEAGARLGRVGVVGSVAFPTDPADWRALALHADVEARVDAAEAAATAPEDWALPELVGAIAVDGRFDGTLGTPGGTARLDASGLAVGERAIQTLEVEVALEGSLLSIARLVAVTDFGRAEASGGVDLADGTLSDTAFDVSVPDLQTLATLFPALPPLEGSLGASGVLAGTLRPDASLPADGFPDDVHVSAQADAEGLVIDGARLGTVSAALTLDGPRLAVERVRVDGDLGRLDASGTAQLVERSVSVPGFAVELPDIAALARYVPALESVQGSVAAEGSFRRDADEEWRDARAGLTAHTPLLHVPGARITDVTLRVDLDDGRAVLHEAVATTDWGTLRAAGRLGRDGETVTATLERLDVDLDRAVLGLAGEPLPLRLRAPVAVAWDPDRLAVSGLDAEFLGGRVRVDLARGRDATLSGSAENLDLALVTDAARGRLSGTIELAGDPARPVGTLTARVPELSWEGERGSLEIDAHQDADGLHVARCEIAAGRLLHASAEGYAPLLVGESGGRRLGSRRATMRLTASSESPDLWLSRFAPEGVHAAHAALSCDADGPRLDASLVVRDLEWRGDEATRVALDGDTTITLSSSETRSTATIDAGGAGPLSMSGALEVGGIVDWREPLTSLDALPDAPLAGTIRIAVADVSDVATWFEDLRSVRGAAHVDLALSGTVAHPDWRGAVAADDLSVTAIDDIPPIDRGRLRATLAGRTATIDELDVRLGYAPVAVTGSVTLGNDDVPVFDLHAVGADVQIVRTQFTRVRADVDARIRGPLSRLTLAGTARVTDAWYTRPTAASSGRGGAGESGGFQLFSTTAEPWASLRFDVAVSADETVLVDNNVAFGRLSLDMRLRGTGAVPEPEGRVWCRNVAVRLPVTRLTVESATLTFPPERPFDPDLRVSGFTRIKGYDLDVQVSGGASDMRVLIATSPPLRQEDALVLLATGAPPAAEAAGGQVGASAAAGGAAVLGEAAMQWLSGPRTAGEERITDRVEVYIGREVSESGIATLEAEVELFPGWYLRFERDRWEDYAAGLLWRVRFP